MTEANTPLLAAALRYASHGMHVFPLRVRIINGKKKCTPITNWDDQSTTSEARIRKWFGPGGDYRTASLAIDCGKSGLVVIDPDGAEGVANWEQFRTRHRIGATWADGTPGGGQHWYYRADPQQPVKNSTSKIANRIDTRGVGGFVIAPPSRDDRGVYYWLEGEPEWEALPVVPAAVIAVVNGSRPAPGDDRTRPGAADPHEWLMAGDRPRSHRFTHEQAVAFCRPHVEALRTAQDGQINDRLNTAAKVLSHFIPAFWSEQQAREVLHEALNSTVYDAKTWQADATIDSALRSAAADWRAEKVPPPAGDSTGPDEPPENFDQPAPPALVFQTIAELAAEVDAAGPRKWLLRGVWPAGDYGVHAAEKKAQKTWNTADLVVSVASGMPWLGKIEVDAPGPVLMFVGEGGKANTLRRLRAVAEARGVLAETLPIVVCTRAPHLGDRTHRQLLADQIHAQRPVLVTLDPLYLSAAGASLADLYAMGALLEAPQRICQDAGSALWIVTHFNRKAGSGAGRITGAGPAEWGRVLISAEVTSRRTDPRTRASDVIIALEVIGGEVPDRALTLHRRIWSDDPDDLDAPLHLECTLTEHDTPEGSQSDADGKRLSPAAAKLLEALTEATEPRSIEELGDAVAARHGHGLTRQTVSTALNTLERAGLATSVDRGRGRPKYWLKVDLEENKNRSSDPSATGDRQ